ncbi:uncharacterized protein LOC107420985 [Ziziphus jujuba]|uniref:GrpE protein homolog n=1 Tax=Ziziphus jujuba TaxID=326968 RepID=A0A6P3ZYC0_ZIZJJ|nr:uncharacterized protein LOC107420985 [Ziziphus jujuba]
MAVSFSNHCFLAHHHHRRLSASWSSTTTKPPSKTLKYSTLSVSSDPSPLICKPIVGFSNSSSLLRPSFNTHLAARYSVSTTNGEEDGQSVDSVVSGAGGQHVFSLKTLIKEYKEAILDGDEKTVLDVEARIDRIEKEMHELDQKLSTLTADITSGKEKYIRLQADFDNFRKRSEKERLTVRTNAQGEVIESLLPMVDNFERAKQQIKPETEKEIKIDASYQGIYKQFVEIMRSLHVAVVATVGKPFDPLLHEAIAREESHEFKEGIIIQEFRRGFLLGDRLLRPATVKVSSGPGRKKAPLTHENSSGPPAATAGIDDR